jgi:cytochrome d ubiquinol oxidase subunit II
MDATGLAVTWFGLLGALLAGYAVLDGFDLGVGILHLAVARDDRERRALIGSIGPLWDGNEVWLVVFGGALFAAFPSAYATVFSGFYTAFMVLLFALIFRAVSIEFRGKRAGRRWRGAFDVGFCAASSVVSFLFGVAVGNAMLGLPLDARGDYAGTLLGQLHPYALLVGGLVVALFALHGAAYLGLRLEGALARRAHAAAWHCFGIFLVLFLLVTIATLTAVPRATANFERWPLLWAVPVANVLAIANVPRTLYRGRPGQAFVSSSAMILALVALLGAALYPNLVASRPDPAHGITIFDAASSPHTLTLMLAMAGFGMPLVLAYTGIVYWTFRGRVREDGTGY